jgi:hypothetical protein
VACGVLTSREYGALRVVGGWSMQAAVRSARPIVQIAHIFRSMAQFLKVSIP